MSEITVDYKIDADTEEGIEQDHFSGGAPPFVPDRPFGPNGNGHHDEPEPDSEPPIGNAVLAMMLFIGTDIMFFAALIGAFLVFRIGATDWPPPNQPLLPVAVTGVNTLILLISGFTMALAWRKIRQGDRSNLVRSLIITAVLGTTFLFIQGFEWIRLVGFGLTLSSSIYGATFYTIIGCHALHVAGAVLALLGVMQKAIKGKYTAEEYTGVQLCGMYWLLVVLMWPVLYSLVYFN